MSETQKHLWKQTKAAIILRFGTLECAAKELGCSVDGLRVAIKGRCPGVLQKMIVAGLLSPPSEPKPKDNSPQ
jgi:hypothetical protein